MKNENDQSHFQTKKIVSLKKKQVNKCKTPVVLYIHTNCCPALNTINMKLLKNLTAVGKTQDETTQWTDEMRRLVRCFGVGTRTFQGRRSGDQPVRSGSACFPSKGPRPAREDRSRNILPRAPPADKKKKNGFKRRNGTNKKQAKQKKKSEKGRSTSTRVRTFSTLAAAWE